MRPQCLLALLVLLLPLISAVGLKPWTPVNISDPHVKALGEFAVTEYNKNTTLKLVFQSLLSGKTTPRGSGLWYEIVIAAKNESLPSSANYLVGVLETPKVPLELHTFRRLQS
ncbi:hypothetical protein M0R45_017167 [Rubus argutus]|uniref:Cystatin domain-containing protein n=1 Tax=Rubus argutus TaxID=59490 RepID=A0AAW1XV46_RUBAR